MSNHTNARGEPTTEPSLDPPEEEPRRPRRYLDPEDMADEWDAYIAARTYEARLYREPGERRGRA